MVCPFNRTNYTKPTASILCSVVVRDIYNRRFYWMDIAKIKNGNGPELNNTKQSFCGALTVTNIFSISLFTGENVIGGFKL